ncbi:MAG: tRNA(Ile)-lysidine synthase [Solirubrobacteraceae bacterium]|nr:tRNA(Ile)-lysidine synthase [Solirubrobacteraceae bacterium]
MRARGADLEARVRAGGLLQPGRAVVVLLSGGPDSVCLLDLAVRVAGAPAVSALHVNYGLRESAGEDEALCRAVCERLGVPLSVHRPGPPEGNLQAWARDQRYAAAAGAAREREADVAAGHTASDQVETVLYRLAASPGRRALLGRRERDGRLVRPLLEVWRAATEAWCAEAGLPWREDPSNASDDYARNRARHGLVPVLRELHPAAERNVLRTLELLRDEAEVLDAAVTAALAEAGSPPSAERLRALPPALARLAVQRLADAAGGPAVSHRTEEILELGEHGALDVGGGLRARIEGGRLEFVATPPRVHA